jgi:hypothetical protein
MSIQLTPPPERDFPAGRLQLRKEQLVSQIFTTAGPPVTRRPRRGLVLAIAAATAAILASAAYAGYALTRPATHLKSIGCYEDVSLTANTAVVDAGSGPPAVTCAEKWSSAFPGVARPASFAACVLDSGAIGVFPADTGDPCAKLGVAALSKTPSAPQPSP